MLRNSHLPDETEIACHILGVTEWNTLIKALHFSGLNCSVWEKRFNGVWDRITVPCIRPEAFFLPQARSLPPTAPKIFQAVTIFIPSYYTSLSNEAEQPLIKEDQNRQESHGC